MTKANKITQKKNKKFNSSKKKTIIYSGGASDGWCIKEFILKEAKKK